MAPVSLRQTRAELLLDEVSVEEVCCWESAEHFLAVLLCWNTVDCFTTIEQGSSYWDNLDQQYAK